MIVIIVIWWTEAVDPDLDSLLADLCKLEEETAAAAAAGDTKPPLNVGLSEAEQMSSEEFASFMESLQQSKNIIHDPISLVIYDTVKQAGRPSQLQPAVTPEQQKNVNERRKTSKPAPLQHLSQLSVQRPPSLSTPLSPSHVSLHNNIRFFHFYNFYNTVWSLYAYVDKLTSMLLYWITCVQVLSLHNFTPCNIQWYFILHNFTLILLTVMQEQVQQQLELFAQQLELDESLTPVSYGCVE